MTDQNEREARANASEQTKSGRPSPDDSSEPQTYGNAFFEPGKGGFEATRDGGQGGQRDDASIESDIRAQLSANHELDGSNIDVRVERGVVVLSGSVVNSLQQQVATDAVRAVQGVTDVNTELRVQSEE